MSGAPLGRAGVALALVALAGCAAVPRPTELPPAARQVLAVGAGRALAADDAGRLYVLDAADATVRVLAPRSPVTADSPVEQVRYGGRGTGAEAFLAPAGLDPTNGLVLWVADEGAGEVARLSTEGRRGVPLGVPDLDAADGRSEPARGAARGRPVAVATRAGVTFVADAGRGHVLRFRDDRLDGVLGGPADGAAALASPRALALARDGTLYVADGRRVQPFGALGRARPAVALGFEAASVALAGERLLVAGGEAGRAALAVGPVGGPLARVALGLAEPLVGAVATDGGLFVLTPTRLVRFPLGVLAP